jgi:adenosylhomocysteine nucleosidase
VSRLGVVTGYRGEAACLAEDRVLARVLCSGADASRARAAAERLRDEGAQGLVSFGLAGALAPERQPGDLLLPATVILSDGRRLAADPTWRGRLASVLDQAGLSASHAPIAGSDWLLATAEAKRVLFGKTGGVAVDMESHVVAEVAAKAGMPFVVVRAVADRSDQPIPGAAQGAIDANGEVRHLAVLRGLMRSPWEIGALVGLGRSSARGLATLRRVAALAPGLGFV